ncbi:PRTRC system protein A (plasmid) [Pararobbsia alpina]|uniref:PRTRC system protein A n=1 Tax=Pararobbsia alpina TaxID=621374 RepID=UPI0039A4C256
MNPIDQTLQMSFPTVMVPRRESVAPMVGLGERLLAASNGVFIEIVRPWVHIVRRIASFQVRTAIPYGVAEEVTELLCGKVPGDVISEFARLAQEASPKETGAWIVWSEMTRRFRMVPVQILSHSEGHLRYDRPEIEADEVLVIDCHSHGRGPAFFSRTDNADDAHDVKFALVLGHCDTDRFSAALRLCAKGIFEETSVPATWTQSLSVREVQ